jgi:hypothetical protein
MLIAVTFVGFKCQLGIAMSCLASLLALVSQQNLVGQESNLIEYAFFSSHVVYRYSPLGF